MYNIHITLVLENMLFCHTTSLNRMELGNNNQIRIKYITVRVC
jgi:hypothetical protein